MLLVLDPGYGDYPKMRWMGKDGHDPYEHFDYKSLGYNYGETPHPYALYSAGDRYNPDWEKKAYYSK